MGPVVSAAFERIREGLRVLRAHPSLLAANLAVVFLPVLLVQLAVPTLMRSRTSPLPGGAMLGALVVLLLVAGGTRVAYARARRALPLTRAATRVKGEVVALAVASVVVLLVGQSLLSGLAELIGVVRSGPDGGTGFNVDYPRYAIITTLSYAWTVSVLTLLVVCLRLGAPLRHAR